MDGNWNCNPYYPRPLEISRITKFLTHYGKRNIFKESTKDGRRMDPCLRRTLLQRTN